MTTEERPTFHWKTNIAWKNKDRIVIRGAHHRSDIALRAACGEIRVEQG